MKKIATVVFVAALSLNVQGQQSKVVSAYNSLKMYLQDKTDIEVLKNAKTFIDEASANESTSGKPKTWYYKGNVYWAIQESKNPAFSNFDSNSNKVVIKMKKEGGVFTVPCKINDLPLDFIFDTGASSVSISLTEAMFMLKNGKLVESDFLGKRNYMDANGNITEGTLINLRQIEIGGKYLSNVEASVVNNMSAPLLLGQSAMSRIGNFQFDPNNGTLTFDNINSDPSLSSNSSNSNYLLVAVESYRKAYELDPKYEFAIECFGKALAGYRNLGIAAFNKNDFNAALSMFEETTALSAKNGIVDTNSIENSSIAAMKGKNVDKAQEYLTKLIGFGKEKDGTRYASLYRIYLQKGDTTTAMKVLADARLAFPNDQRLLTEELNNYLSRGKAAEAEKLLAIAIEKDPTNHLLPYAAGTVYEDLGKREEAIAAYKKAIELKADYWEAYFNLGALYNNSGKALIDKANAEKDTKKYDAINKLAEVEFNLALPNLEKALELAPADSQDVVPLLKTLKQIYSRLNMTDKYNEVKKRLEP